MKFSFLITCLIVATGLTQVGCATGGTAIRIDGSSQEKTNNSLKQMSESLSPYDLCRLKAAILRIQIGDTSSWNASNKAQQDNSDPLGAIINGMTFTQIIDHSQRYPDKVGSSCRQ